MCSIPGRYPHVLAYGRGNTLRYWNKYWHAYISICSTVSFRSIASYAIVQCSLGFDVMHEGMHISDSKVQSLSEWPVPTTVK